MVLVGVDGVAQLNENLNAIEGGWKTNLEVRPEQDWIELGEGKAVTK